MSPKEQSDAPPLVVRTFTIRVADNEAFAFSYRADGAGSCRDIEYGNDHEISFSWDVELVDGLDPEECEEALRDHAVEIFWNEINDQLDEDRVLQPEDYGSEDDISFSCGSNEDLERFVRLTLYSFPSIWEEQRDEVSICIDSTTACEEAQVSKYCDFIEDGEISEADKSAISQLIGFALQWNDPTGFHLEYNDGPSNRASGYHQSANTVAYSIARPSFHELAEARHALIGILAEHGLAEKGEALLPKGERENGKRPISQ